MILWRFGCGVAVWKGPMADGLPLWSPTIAKSAMDGAPAKFIQSTSHRDKSPVYHSVKKKSGRLCAALVESVYGTPMHRL